MTTQDIINYYANLLILQYQGNTRAYAMIQALVTPVVMDQLPLIVQSGFNIPTAVGTQLDVLGKYAGVVRTGFSLTGIPITLDDADFAQLITMAIGRNNAGSSLATIQAFLETYFDDEVFVFDYANMRLSYFIDSSVGSQNLVELFVTEGLLPKPMGVTLSGIVYGANLTHFFGMRTTKFVPPNIEPFNSVQSYNQTWPWFSVSKAISGY